MCGRYALGIRAAFVRHQLQQRGMQVDDYPDDEDVRQTYNFAPGYHGLVYRADVPDWGAGGSQRHTNSDEPDEAIDPETGDGSPSKEPAARTEVPGTTRYKLQSMQWGLVPFWTKRSPDYASVMRTINARDDSLAGKGGMWASMKLKKRCIVVAQGFYEWLKKNNGKEKIPHFVKRKDGELMCFAGLWDCVQYDTSEEKHYTYTIITTDNNKQLAFLHDRMPVILENGSEEIRTWLDPGRTEWTPELQSLLKPFSKELEIYPVSKDVGKVGNDSPMFIIPVASAENKHNIANFFGNARKPKDGQIKKEISGQQNPLQADLDGTADKDGETRVTVDTPSTEDNAPKPFPKADLRLTKGVKREYDDADIGVEPAAPPKPNYASSRNLKLGTPPSKKLRSATNNASPQKAKAARSQKSAEPGSQKITTFLK